MNFHLPSWIKPGMVIALLACLLIFSGLNRFDLRGSTEPREAGVAAEMLQNNQFLLPTLNGEAFLEKPPLSYWLQAASIKIFGYEAFAPRVPSALAGIATALLFVFFFRKSEQSDWLTLLSGILLITMGSFWEYSRTAGQDILLAFGVSLALLSFYFTRENGSKLLWLAYSAGIAIATLTKGVVGLAVPGVVIFVFLLVETIYFDKRLVILNWLNPVIFTLLGLLPILGWLWALFDAQGIESVKEIVWTNSVGRFEGSYTSGAHAEPFYYYLKKLPETFQPWSLLFYIAIWQSARFLGTSRRMVFFFCWLAVPFILLSISAGKRPSYLLMLYPAAAAFLAHYIVSFAQQASATGCGESIKSAKWLVVIQAVFFSAGVLFTIFRLVQVHVPVIAGVTLLLAIPALFVMWRSVSQLRIFSFVASSVGILIITYIAYFSFVVPHDDERESAKLVIERLAYFSAAGRPLALYQPTERIKGATSFYLQRRLPTISSMGELQKILAEKPDTVVLIEESSQLDFAHFKDEGQVNYGKTHYHYLTRKQSGVER